MHSFQVLFVPDGSSPYPLVEQRSPPSQTTTPSALSKSKDNDAFVLLAAEQRSSSGTSPPSTQQDAGGMVWSMGRQSTAKPGRAQRLKSEPSSESESTSSRPIEDRVKTHQADNHQQVKQLQKTFSVEENQQLDEECLQRFIKVNVRLMTEDRVSSDDWFGARGGFNNVCD